MMKRQEIKGLNQQSGVVLIVGLVMVLMLTIIGLASIRGSGMQEMMAGNMRDHNMAFQTSEAAIRAAEMAVKTYCPNFTNSGGCYTDQNVAGTPVISWTAAQWKDNAIIVDDLELENISKEPLVVIEQISYTPVGGLDVGGCIEMAAGCNEEGAANLGVYRITSTGYGGSEDSQVIIQTTLKKAL